MMKYLSLATLAFSASFYATNVSAQEIPQIDFNEIQKKFEEMTNQEFLKIDTNNDGEISLSEYQDYIVKQTIKDSEKSFAKLDTDNDGKISQQEYSAFMSGFTARIKDAIQN